MRKPAAILAAAVLALATAILSGCGFPQPASDVAPAYQTAQASAPLNASPLAKASLVLLGFETEKELSALNIDVPEQMRRSDDDDDAKDGGASPKVRLALTEQHRRSLRDMGVASAVYSSLTEAERSGAVAPLVIRAVVKEYKPTWQKRMGGVVRVALSMKIRYDIWNPRDREAPVTIWVEAEPGDPTSYVEFESAGEPSADVVAQKIAGLLQAQFERFNNDLVSNQRVASLATKG
jgi:hypothetical protein